MAYILSQDDEEKNKNLGNTNQLLSEAPTGEETPTTGGGSSMGGPKGGADQDNPGFANLMQYMGANEEQASGLADQISGNLGNEYNAAKGSIDSASGKASDAARNSTINYDDSLVSGAVKNPSSFVQDPANVSKFQGQRDASYSGPGSFEDSSFYGEAAKGNARGRDIYEANKTGGYEGLLSQLESNPTKGKSALDIGLLNANPTASGKIQTALQPFQGLQGYLTGKSADVNKEIEGARNTTDETRSKTRGAVGQAANDFNTEMTKRLTDSRASAGSASEALKQKLLSGQQLTSQELASLGINGTNYTELNNVIGSLKGDYGDEFDKGHYYEAQNPDVALRPENIASQDDFARESALQQLMGEDLPFLNDSLSGEAGTAPKSLSKYNIDPAYADARGVLSSRDTAQLQKYQNPSMQWNGTNQELATTLKAFQRNRESLNPQQKTWLSVMEGQQPGSPFTPTDPGVNQPGTTPGDGLSNPEAPPASGESRTKVIEQSDGSGGKQMWWDGSNWVAAPKEFSVKDGRKVRFDYNTGQYVDEGPYSGGAVGPVARAF